VKKEVFFLKKEPKTFVPWRVRRGWRIDKKTKVFCFFSSEKKTFLRHDFRHLISAV
jgi:hypothetical protein